MLLENPHLSVCRHGGVVVRALDFWSRDWEVGGSRLRLLVSALHRVCLFVCFFRETSNFSPHWLPSPWWINGCRRKKGFKGSQRWTSIPPPGWRGDSNIPRCFMLRILQLGTSCVIICCPKCGVNFLQSKSLLFYATWPWSWLLRFLLYN